MDFHNGSPLMYFDVLNRAYRYEAIQERRDYLPTLDVLRGKPASEGSSIDDILRQDSDAVLDKLNLTSSIITSRMRLHDYVTYSLDYQWLQARNKVHELEGFFPGINKVVQRTKDGLTKEMLALDKDKLDEKVQCWKDLITPMTYFVELFHQYQQLKQDKKLLGGGK